MLSLFSAEHSHRLWAEARFDFALFHDYFLGPLDVVNDISEWNAEEG